MSISFDFYFYLKFLQIAQSGVGFSEWRMVFFLTGFPENKNIEKLFFNIFTDVRHRDLETCMLRVAECGKSFY